MSWSPDDHDLPIQRPIERKSATDDSARAMLKGVAAVLEEVPECDRKTLARLIRCYLENS